MAINFSGKMANFFESFLASYLPAAQAESQRRFAREQADKETEQNRTRNRIAILQAVGGLKTSDETKNALLAALDPEAFSVQKTAAIASPSVPTAQSVQPIGYGQPSPLNMREPTNIGLQVADMPKTSGIGMKVLQEPAKAPTIATPLITPKTVSGTVARDIFKTEPEKPAAPSLSAIGTFISSSIKSGLSPQDVAKALQDKAGITIDPSAIDMMRSTDAALAELKRKQVESLIALNEERKKLTQAQTARTGRQTTGTTPSQITKLGEFFTKQKNDLMKFRTKAEENLKDLQASLGYADESTKAILEQKLADAQTEIDDFDIRLEEIQQQIEQANQLVGQALESEGEKITPSTKPKTGLKKVPGFSE